ncbi:PREDICTED: ubiquitin carboxyl-terminal hydrolase 12-like [Camelina sativa]|uniref:Ubiquitin carboxyl-terminal hydrolase 12-like n=1 Tax=Camelina sativa TaxID=90675 RepID=A0ABM1RDJ8_CAMSA|nr:PREDICTED: ubiquitin carboxyl-terminal hydrolase 12-like [Camelina sativa]
MWKEEKSCVVANSTITSKFEDRPPSTYSMKIRSFSQLNTLFPDDRYKSRSFSSGKYNWRLVLYTKGNKADKGSGFISMYVELDTSSLTASTVLAYLTFFIYNKKENKYFTIQDAEGKQFNAIRPVWGFSQVLPLDTFNDPEKGYVFEGDQCEFGVDVLVPLANWEVVSFDQQPSNPKFSWTLNKFSKLKETTYQEVFNRKKELGGKVVSQGFNRLQILISLSKS